MSTRVYIYDWQTTRTTTLIAVSSSTECRFDLDEFIAQRRIQLKFLLLSDWRMPDIQVFAFVLI